MFFANIGYCTMRNVRNIVILSRELCHSSGFLQQCVLSGPEVLVFASPALIGLSFKHVVFPRRAGEYLETPLDIPKKVYIIGVHFNL